MSRASRIKGIISAILFFIFCLIFVPIIAALAAGVLVVWLGRKIVPLASIAIVIVILLAIPLAFWSAWKRYRKYNPPKI